MDYPITVKTEGFKDQRLVRLPARTARICDRTPVVGSAYPESIGHYPYAPGHFVERPDGIDNNMIILCTAGSGFIEIAGTRQEVAPGQIVTIPRNAPHRYGALEHNPWGKYWTHFNGKDSDSLLKMIQQDPSVYIYDIQDTAEAVEHFDELYERTVQAHTPETLLNIHNALLSWLLCILRLRGPSGSRARRADEKIASAIRSIENHCEREYSVEMLARESGMSEASFYREFKKQTGGSPVSFITRVRMQKACQLLDMTRMQVSEVGREVGYEDPYYFSRVFSKTMGTSPAAYRSSDTGGGV